MANQPGVEYLITQGVFCVMFVMYFWYSQQVQLKEKIRMELAQKDQREAREKRETTEREYQQCRDREAREAQQKLVESQISFMRDIAPILQKLQDEVKANQAIVMRIENKVEACDDRRLKQIVHVEPVSI